MEFAVWFRLLLLFNSCNCGAHRALCKIVLVHVSERSMLYAGKIVGAAFHAWGLNRICCVNLREQMFCGVETPIHFVRTICLKYLCMEKNT